MADRVLAARKGLVTERDGLRDAQQRLDTVAASLERREQEAEQKARSLRQQLDEIDAKAVALKSIQQASRVSGGVAAPDFEEVEREVQELATKIDVELAFQDEKWNQSDSNDLDALQAVIRGTSTSADTISEIDKVLSSK
jgi:phage shock protein A